MTFPDHLLPILRENEPLAGYTWLRIGGNARYFAEPTDKEQLADLVKYCESKSIAVRILGGGSNLLIREAGVDGCVVSLASPAFSQIRVEKDLLVCGCGAKLSHAITHAVGAGLAGIEHLVGIPGTVGGAVHGNSGTLDGDIGERIESAVVLDRSGRTSIRERSSLQFATRKSSLDELVVLEVTLKLEKADVRTLTQRMQKTWIVKRAAQPPMQSAAIIPFVDPDLISASKLIEQAGVKGASHGLVRLCSTHGNFLIASDGATSDQVLALLDNVREKVASKTGTQLQMHLTIW